MTHRTIFSSFTAAAALATILALPGTASANTYWHSTIDETGAQAYPDHFQSGKTRAQVKAEAESAMREGGDSRFFASNYPSAVNSGVQAGADNGNTDQRLGSTGFSSQALKTVDISNNAQYLNIVCGETVVFNNGKEQFAWKFDVIGHQVVDLASIAPAGFSNSPLKIYVAKNHLERF